MSPLSTVACSPQVLATPHGEGSSSSSHNKMCTWGQLSPNGQAGMQSSLKSIFQFKSVSLAECLFLIQWL